MQLPLLLLMTPIQEGGAASSTDVAEQFSDATEVEIQSVGESQQRIGRNSGRTERRHRVRVVYDRLETWRFGVCSLKYQHETAEIIWQKADDRTRRVKTILRKTPRNSHDSLGHCESAIKEVEKQIRVMSFHTW